MSAICNIILYIHYNWDERRGSFEEKENRICIMKKKVLKEAETFDLFLSLSFPLNAI